MNNLQPGQMLGPYRIINQIGRGGMATVYKAYQPSMDRYVAIKVLPSELAESKEFTGRFQQEARIIARLEHAHILPVFDYGESDGVSYLVMRYLEAGTLKDKLDSHQLSLNEIDRILTQLGEALSYAHSHGVVHRDLKPSNALIDAQENLFLTDFGIAKLLEGTSHFTNTDAVMGTPAYISPEQAQGQPVDQRSDIYSVGIILYEMVTGRVPFTADTPLAVIFKHVSDPLPLPSSVKPDIPKAIEQVILKALAKRPEDRFDTAAEFLAAWKRALADSETASRAPMPAPTMKASAPQLGAATQATVATTSPATLQQSSMRWIAGCIIAACLLLTVGGGIFLFSNRQNIPFINSQSTQAASITNTPESPQSTSINGDSQSSQATPVANHPGGNQFTVKIGDEISKGVPESGAGFIEEPGAKDIYTFTAEAGQKIYVHIIEPPQTNDIVDIYMKDDLGADVFYGCMQCGDPGAITLERGGTYTLTVGNDDPANAGSGAYRIKLWNLPPPDTFAIHLDDEIANGVPDKGAGFIEIPGANDVYTFTADAGQMVYFQVKQQPQTNDLINWRVKDEVEHELFNTCLQCGDPGIITLDHGGTYTIIVGNKSGAATGTYSIKVWTVPSPNTFTIHIGDTIAKDVPGAGAGFIETPGAHDIYNFTLDHGQTITFQVKQQPQTNDLINWRLVDEHGKEIFNTCLQCGDPGSFTLEGGTYSVIVGNDSGAATGTYQLVIFSS